MAEGAFNWRDYITLSNSFSPSQKTLVENSLDSITAAHDHEGEELIRKATALNPPKLTIQPTAAQHSRNGVHNITQGGYSGINHVITVDFNEIAAAAMKDGGSGPARHLSMTGFMVHEMFHAADPVASTRSHSVMNQMDDDEITKEQNNGAIPVRRGNNLTEDDVAKVYSVTKTHTQDRDGVPITEDRATKYTDAFMQKNFGSQEPLRVKYTNQTTDPTVAGLTDEQKLERIPIPVLSREIFQTAGYAPAIDPGLAEKLGPLPTPPIVRPNAVGRNGPS